MDRQARSREGGGRQARPNGAGQKAQSSSGPGDADAAWEEMQKKQRERQGGRAARDDPGVLRERLDEALRRLREATPRAVSALRGLIPMPEGGGLEFDPDCDEPMMLPPQVTELLVRGDVTVTVGDPNVGKSQLLSATALAIAHDAVTELLGEPGDGWLGAALFASNEEKPSYVRARWRELIRKLPLEKRKKRDKLILWEAARSRTVRKRLARSDRGWLRIRRTTCGLGGAGNPLRLYRARPAELAV